MGTRLSHLLVQPARALVVCLTVLAAVSVLSVSGRAQSAGAGTIRGRVEILDGAPAERPATRALGLSEIRATPERRRAVVYLSAQQGRLEHTTEPVRATIDQRGETFLPRVLAVTVGSTVDFPNSDPIYHNVFSLSRARSFDLGRYPAGRSKSVRFDRPGVVRVFCDIHSHMSASILVFAHPFYAVTADDGSYRIGGVPPGTYLVNAWMENRPTQSREVVIASSAPQTELDFSFVVRRPR